MCRPDGRFYQPQFRNDGCILSRIAVEMGLFLKKKTWEKLGGPRRKMVVFDQFYAKNLLERLKFQFSDEFFPVMMVQFCVFVFRRNE